MEEYKPFVRKMLQNLDVISIRERSSLPLLASLGREDGVAVCDPVFLLSKGQWNEVASHTHEKERYLLVYDTEHSAKIQEIAQQIAKEKKLKIYNVSGFRLGYVDKDMWASSPLDFVQLVRDADYVVSNSFHATAFSLIFERDFCVVNRSEGINERMKSLLMSYNVEDRLVNSYSASLLNSIDYRLVNPLMQKNIDDSKSFLLKILMS